MSQATGNPIERRRTEFRAGLLALALPLLPLGIWATVAPKSWFEDFPGGGRHWVSAIGPYNEHLATDVGAFFLAISCLLIFAAIVLELRVVQAALGALLIYSVPHLIYHLTELDAYGTLDKVLNVISLSLLVVVPAVMLWMTRGPRRAAAPGTASEIESKGEVTYGTH
jgi:hypothetical protein